MGGVKHERIGWKLILKEFDPKQVPIPRQVTVHCPPEHNMEGLARHREGGSEVLPGNRGTERESSSPQSHPSPLTPRRAEARSITAPSSSLCNWLATSRCCSGEGDQNS